MGLTLAEALQQDNSAGIYLSGDANAKLLVTRDDEGCYLTLVHLDPNGDAISTMQIGVQTLEQVESLLDGALALSSIHNERCVVQLTGSTSWTPLHMPTIEEQAS